MTSKFQNTLQLKTNWHQRPWWMNLLWLFCLYMTFIYMPWDSFYKPQHQWEQVWFGFTLRGWPAKLTEPVHWAIYAAGAWGFFKMRAWMWPWAALYCGQVAVAMIVFNILEGPGMGDGRGGGVSASIVIGGSLVWLTFKLWRAQALFQHSHNA